MRDIGTDDPRVKVRARKGSRPRTKRRPDYSDRPAGRVISIDRGRYGVATEAGPTVVAVKARELPRDAVVIGDVVRMTGDLTGTPDTLARIVHVDPRKNVLRRSLEDTPDARGEKIIVANADLMVIVTAAADPTPRVGMVERALVAAHIAGIPSLLVMTKTDLADPKPFIANFPGFNLDVVTTADGVEDVRDHVVGKFSVLIGHSGVGKSTLLNALIPGADRAVGDVNVATGKGRHTSTSAVALRLPEGGWMVDTPGVRSFGLGHAQEVDVLEIFPGVYEATAYCLPNCSHFEGEPSCALDEWVAGTGPFQTSAMHLTEGVPEERRKDFADRARTLLAGLPKEEWEA